MSNFVTLGVPFSESLFEAPLPKSARACIFTIVSRNYLHYARTLMESVRQHAPQADCVVALCDERDGIDASVEPFRLLPLADLHLPQHHRFVFQYSILELNTAIKPFVFQALFAEGYGKVIYFDPDIALYHNLDDMLARLNVSEVLLTPHIVAPINDDKFPDEPGILQTGAYNLGFVAMANKINARNLLAWWSQRLETQCVDNKARGVFVDQKWMDLAPSLFNHVEVVRHVGWNVAYWNLAHRTLSLVDGVYHVALHSTQTYVNEVGCVPLVFFHFSGYKPGVRGISRYQNRFDFDNVGEVVRNLFLAYDAAQEANGRAHYATYPYAHGAWADGTRIPDAGRAVVRQAFGWSTPLPNLYSNEGRMLVTQLLNQAAGYNPHALPILTRLGWALYQADAALQKRYPDCFGKHRVAVVSALVNGYEVIDESDTNPNPRTVQRAGVKQIDEVFLAPMRQSLRHTYSPLHRAKALVLRIALAGARRLRGQVEPHLSEAWKARARRWIKGA